MAQGMEQARGREERKTMIFKSKISVECYDNDGVIRTHALAGIDDEELNKLLIEWEYDEQNSPNEYIQSRENEIKELKKELKEARK